MNHKNTNHVPHVPIPTTEFDYTKFDSIESLLEDAAKYGFLEDLRERLCSDFPPKEAILKVIRELAYELAGAKNRDFAVDVLLHASGLAEIEQHTLRDYALKHRCSHEWFRQKVLECRERLGLYDAIAERRFPNAKVG